LKKLLKPQPLTRSEKRAADVDRWVKRHVAEQREADEAKTSRLRRLRMEQQALRDEPAAESESGDTAPKPRIRRIWVSGPGASNVPAAKKIDD
jgi:hypothetical protein